MYMQSSVDEPVPDPPIGVRKSCMKANRTVGHVDNEPDFMQPGDVRQGKYMKIDRPEYCPPLLPSIIMLGCRVI